MKNPITKCLLTCITAFFLIFVTNGREDIQGLTKIVVANLYSNSKRIASFFQLNSSAYKRWEIIEKLKKLNSLQLINHRGYTRIAPENTLSAFRVSKMQGYDWVETDIRLTSDGVIVLLHDASINRTARNFDGTKISKTLYINHISYADALKYDFGVWKSNNFAGEKIPTLAQTLNLCKCLDLKLTIEIKSSEIKLPDLITLVEQYGMTDRVEYLSGNKRVIGSLSKLLSNGHIGYNGPCDSSLHTYLSSIRGNGNIIYYHTNIYANNVTRRAILDEIAHDGFVIVSRVYSAKAVIDAPVYSTIYITGALNPKKALYDAINEIANQIE